MQIDSTLSNIEELTQNANSVKELVLTTLLNNKIITEEIAKEYFENYQVIIIKHSWFKQWMDMFKKDANAYSYKYVKF